DVMRKGKGGGVNGMKWYRGGLKSQIKHKDAIRFAQHIEGGADDLRPDAVARKDEETGWASVKHVGFGLICQRHLLCQGERRLYLSSHDCNLLITSATSLSISSRLLIPPTPVP